MQAAGTRKFSVNSESSVSEEFADLSLVPINTTFEWLVDANPRHDCMELVKVPVLRACRDTIAGKDTYRSVSSVARSLGAAGQKRSADHIRQSDLASEQSAKKARVVGSDLDLENQETMSSSDKALTTTETGGIKCEIVARHSVEMSEVETSIFKLLRDVLKARGLKTTVRVAGGWVRDKLLGR